MDKHTETNVKLAILRGKNKGLTKTEIKNIIFKTLFNKNEHKKMPSV